MEGLNPPFFTHAEQNVVWIIRIVFKPDVTEFKMRYVIKKKSNIQVNFTSFFVEI